MMRRLWKKETAVESSQLMERSFPYFSPYSMVKYAATELVASTSSHPTNTNHQGRRPSSQQLLLLLPSPSPSTAGRGLRRKNEDRNIFFFKKKGILKYCIHNYREHFAGHFIIIQ